jgi:hypothetical protein
MSSIAQSVAFGMRLAQACVKLNSRNLEQFLAIDIAMQLMVGVTSARPYSIPL